LANRIRQREMSVSLKNSTLIRFKKSSLYLLDKQSLRQHLQDALSVYFWLRDQIFPKTDITRYAVCVLIYTTAR
jgi:hypothetical protein